MQPGCHRFCEIIENAYDTECHKGSVIYLDYAESVMRSFMDMGVLQKDGSINDPFCGGGVEYRGRALERYLYHAAARFCGALGQLIMHGRMTEYADSLLLTYEYLMNILLNEFEPELYAEFWVKELVFAYKGLKGIGIRKDIDGPWEGISWKKYGFHFFDNHYNCAAFAIASEASRIEAGLGGDRDFFDKWAMVLIDKFDHNGMFLEPGAPLSYDLVTRQQLLYALRSGADGTNAGKVRELCHKGALASLMMQSVTGQMPFGGRTNQFLCMDAQLASFFEMMCSEETDRGNVTRAGVYKKGAMNAVASMEQWLGMDPPRHIRQGFHPEMGHGIDSGGIYTVYGMLLASLLGTAYTQSLKNGNIVQRTTPAENGGYIFETSDGFHKIFATCKGYHLEIDKGADPEKEATGLGRLHKAGIMPETALSGSFTGTPTYSYGLDHPSPLFAAIGPVWKGRSGEDMSLAGYDSSGITTKTTVLEETGNRVTFILTYSLDDGSYIDEEYDIAESGVTYKVRGNMDSLKISIPLLVTDGDTESEYFETSEGFGIFYRNGVYNVHAEKYIRTGIETANRNGIYEIILCDTRSVRLVLDKTRNLWQSQ